MSVDGIWYVKLADGDVERVTLDQLDEAFQNGQIDENSMVLADGADVWTKLGDLLGASEVSPPVATAPAAPPQAMYGAVAQARPPVAAGRPVPVTQPLGRAAPATQPMAMMRPPAAQFVPVASSLRPVSVDLGERPDLGDLRYPTPSRKRWVVGAMGAILALGGGAFFAVTHSSARQADAPSTPTFAAAAAVQFPSPVTPSPAAPPPPAPSPQPPVSNPGRSSVMDPTQQQPRALTDDQKKKLLEADKKVKSHQNSRVAGGGGGGGGHREKSTGFTTGGNKFDPLNASF